MDLDDQFLKEKKQQPRQISKGAPIKFEDFKTVMLSEEANHRFKLLIKALRK